MTERHSINPSCACGCGERVSKPDRTWLKGHASRKPRPLCACGCGNRVKAPCHKWVQGHHNRKNPAPVAGYRRQCKECLRWLEFAEFNKRHLSPDGLTRRCKACLKVSQAALDQEVAQLWRKNYREENAEKISAYRKVYNEENKEQNKERWRLYREANVEKRRKYNRQWYAENGKEYDRAWRQKNPEAIRVSRLKRRAAGNVSKEEVAQMVVDQDEKCAYCQKELCGEWEVDHMLPVARGGTSNWSNLAVTCMNCNRRKSAKTVEEFMSL